MNPEMSKEGLENEEGLRRDELSRGNRARQIFDDEMFQEAMTVIRDQIWKDFAATDYKDDAQRTVLRLKLDVLKEFGEEFLRAMATGKMAEEQLSFIEKQMERFKKTRAA